uniref:NADH-ubiquinone oxidoreductase chain 4 n=1 Tax=Abacion magnum TaxID=118452 RepID=S4T0R7_ABAMA|nr:NADH dehydrogenase subunit 4 [Abacion magnum]AFR77020.1 NADH dehydrogenase subunit 4 [Abacion magnum]
MIGLLSVLGTFFVGGNWSMFVLWLGFMVMGFMLKIWFDWIGFSFLGMGFGGDLISFGLSCLSIWVTILMIISSVKGGLINNKTSFMSLALVMLVGLIFVFISLDLLLFYFMFESVLIPIFLLILGWGYQPERLQAGVYLMFYTLFASLPLLIYIFYCGLIVGSGFMFSCYFFVGWGDNFVLYMMGMLAFLVKMPMFLVHLWLPKAHVEAPISGSMILAGVLLKMGGYGILRVGVYFVKMISSLGYLWVGVSLVGAVYLSLVCLRQSDLKALIAYSSVVHMGLVIGGLMTMTYLGFVGAYVLMVGHGLCSSGMFCLANSNYERLQSRSLIVNKGMMNLMPSFCLVWFLLVSSNMAAPPSINLAGEIGLIGALLGWSGSVLVGVGLASFFSAAYCLYLFSSVQHGESLVGLCGVEEGSCLEYLLMLLHWIPLNLLILSGEAFMV